MKKKSSEFRFYDLTEVDEIPHVPGIYVWYAHPQIGRPDWESKIDSLGIDTGDQLFRKVLHEFTSSFAPQSLDVSLRTVFRDGWAGWLEDSKYKENAKRLLVSGERFDHVFLKEGTRKALTEFFDRSLFAFWTPLYIGTSDNLHRRITEHVDRFRKLHEARIEDGTKVEKLREKVYGEVKRSNLSLRLVLSKIHPDQCRITFLDTSHEHLSLEESVKIAEILEWLLNTWNRPILGRK